MIFVETPMFTAGVTSLLTDEEYAAFQRYLIENPDAGDVIQGTGGLRKVRWAAAGKGKSGGVRVIYFYVDEAEKFGMVLIYRKGIQDTLSATEKKQLKAIKERWR